MKPGILKIAFIGILFIEFSAFSMQKPPKISFKNMSEKFATLVFPQATTSYKMEAILPSEVITLTLPVLSTKEDISLGNLIANNNAYSINIRPVVKEDIKFYEFNLIKTDLVKENNRWKTQKVEEKLLAKFGDTLEVTIGVNGSISMKNTTLSSLGAH